MALRDWSTSAGSNNAAPPIGAPEGMSPGSTNNIMREMMASTRVAMEALPFFDFGDTPTRTGNTTFTLSTDLTARYVAGRRIKLVGATTGYASISSSSYGAPNTTVTVVMDSGNVPTSLTTVSVGPDSNSSDSTGIVYRQTPAELAVSVTPVNYYYPPGKIARYMSASQLADWIAATQLVDQKTAIDTALSIGIYVDAAGKFLTSGGHVISTQLFVGDGKATTSFKQKAGGSDIMFQVTSTGNIDKLALDGNSQPGCGLQVTTGQADYLIGVASRVELKNWGGSVTTLNVSAVSKGATTTLTVSANPSTINVAAGTLVRVRSIVGLVSAGNVSKTPLDGVFKVSSVTSTTIVIELDTTGGFTAYTSGGTVEKANYALRVDQATGDYVSWVKQFSDLTFRSNYGHIFLGYSLYINFYNTICVGGTSDFAVYASHYDCEYVTFNGFFAQSGVRTGPWNVRGLKFEDSRFILSGWSAPVYESQGLNESFGNANGEIAKTKFINMFVLRNYSAASYSIFKTNNTDMTIEGLSIVESGSTNWTVFDDTGTVNCRIQDVSVESTNAWDMFTATPSYSSAGGYVPIYENINHFQGTVGTMTLSSAKLAAKNTSLVTVRNSDCNVKINAVNAAADRGYFLQNIQGTVDLTNSSVGGAVLVGCPNTITDPNVAVTINLDMNSGVISINPAATYANNAAALAGGLTAGRLYKTAATGTATLNVTNAT